MKKALRVGYNQYYTDEAFEKHLAYVKRHRSVFDEIVLFAEFSHYGYWDESFSKQNAALLQKRIAQYRSVGVSKIGVNLLCTIGHCEEGWSVFPKAPLPYLVTRNGTRSRSRLCPAGDDFLAHTAARYALYADIGADFIWIDDDVRFGNVCYCDSCIASFNAENHTTFTREELVAALDGDTTTKALWDTRARFVLRTVLETVKTAVKKQNPQVAIGYMSIHSNPLAELVEASGAEKLRPGGGFYNDDRPGELFEKMFSVQYQVSHYPAVIRDVQYEYEAFNYQTLTRSLHLSKLETTLALMSGCSGVLYNDSMFCDREQTATMLYRYGAMWDTLSRTNENRRPAGVFCVTPRTAKAFNEIGIPVTHFLQHAVCAVATGEDLAPLSDEEIRELLSKHLFTDGNGVALLHKRGFGSDCGGKVAAVYDNGMAERFTDHECNGNYRKQYRDAFMNFEYVYNNRFLAYELKPQDDGEVLSCLETTTHLTKDCSLYRIEHNGGVRFAADGYLIPTSLRSAPKREQLGNLLDWLSGGRLPVRLPEPKNVIPSVVTDGQGALTVTLTNASFDDSGTVTCIVRSGGEFCLLGETGEWLPLSQTQTDTETVITLENIPAWDCVVLTNSQHG